MTRKDRKNRVGINTYRTIGERMGDMRDVRGKDTREGAYQEE